MAYFRHFPLIIPLIFIKLTCFVTAEKFNCRFDLCTEDQYCCAENKCCDSPLDLWFLWLGIVIICFVLTIVIIIRCLTKKPPRENRYDRLSTDEC